MASRYSNASPFINNEELYEDFFEDRDVNYIRQFRTGRLSHPTVKDRSRLNTVKHVWGLGSKLYKLAAKHYGDPTLWWVIAWYNMKPTEAHFKPGTVVYIPLPLDRVLAILQRR
jgi:hypothetical protein